MAKIKGEREKLRVLGQTGPQGYDGKVVTQAEVFKFAANPAKDDTLESLAFNIPGNCMLRGITVVYDFPVALNFKLKSKSLPFLTVAKPANGQTENRLNTRKHATSISLEQNRIGTLIEEQDVLEVICAGAGTGRSDTFNEIRIIVEFVNVG